MNLFKTIMSPTTVLTSCWTLVSQDITLIHGIWIALPNNCTVKLKLISTFTNWKWTKNLDQVIPNEYLS